MTLSHERDLKIIYNEGLLKINGVTRKTFFSDKIQEEDKEDRES